MGSNRERKRVVAAGVRELLSRPGWDPGKFRAGTTGIDPAGAMADELRKERAGIVYGAADECPDCMKARESSGDETALCERHMREAMGLG